MSDPGNLPNASESVVQAIPQVPRRKLNLLDIHPLELAQQLSLLEYDLAKDVLITDIEARRAKGRARQPDSVTPCVRFSKHITNWVVLSVLEPGDTPGRAALMEYFISVAHSARGMNNFSSMTSIMDALQSPYVHRLLGSWKLLLKEKRDEGGSCLKTSNVGNNFLYPFITLACLEPPGVPFIDIFLSFKGESDAYHDGLVTRGFSRWQSTPYSFEVDEDIRAFIQEELSQFAGPNGNDPDQKNRFKKLSLDREPENSAEQGTLKKVFNAPSRWLQRLQ